MNKSKTRVSSRMKVTLPSGHNLSTHPFVKDETHLVLPIPRVFIWKQQLPEEARTDELRAALRDTPAIPASEHQAGGASKRHKSAGTMTSIIGGCITILRALHHHHHHCTLRRQDRPYGGVLTTNPI